MTKGTALRGKKLFREMYNTDSYFQMGLKIKAKDCIFFFFY